jgi:integrase
MLIMAKSKSKRKTRSDTFPLTLHATGQYCKKIRGKIYYFGTSKQQALNNYLEQAAYLTRGEAKARRATGNSLSLKMLCNLYLDHQESRATIGEIKLRYVYDQVLILRCFTRFIGANQPVSEIATMDLQNYRRRLIKDGKTASSINDHISIVKAMFHWALDNEVIEDSPRLRAVKKVPSPKAGKPTFTAAQIERLLQHASVQMKAMIWLGLNCGFGCTDCAELQWKNLDLKNDRVIYPRGKTGINRNFRLWPETIQAIKDVPRAGERVFYTSRSNPWVRTIRTVQKDGTGKLTKDDGITKQFSKLMKKAKVTAPKGVGFYTLRRTAATLAARFKDPFAVQHLLGHADLKMATTYVQDVSEQTDRVINDMRKLIVNDGEQEEDAGQ